MTDDWSLKGLDEFPFPTDETSCLEKFYWQKDIETLRQKILDDIKWKRLSFQNLINDEKNKRDFYDTSPFEKEKGRLKALDEVIEIINKRFGVD